MLLSVGAHAKHAFWSCTFEFLIIRKHFCHALIEHLLGRVWRCGDGRQAAADGWIPLLHVFRAAVPCRRHGVDGYWCASLAKGGICMTPRLHEHCQDGACEAILPFGVAKSSDDKWDVTISA